MRRTWAHLLTLLVCASLLTAGLVAPSSVAQAATCTVATTADGRPYYAPTATGPGTGKKVGFDNTHGETAGMADWVLDGGFSDMACALAGQGYTVEEIRAYPLTTTTLNDYNVVVFAEPNIPFTTAEMTALQSYVSGGKGLLMVGDHYQADRNLNTWDATEVFNGFRRGRYNQTFTAPKYNYNGVNTTSTYTFNSGTDWLATAFGFRFRSNAIDLVDAVNNDFKAGSATDPNDPGILPASKTFNITSGVTNVATYAGATISIVDPTKAMGIVYPNKNTLKRWANAQSTDPVAVYTDNVGTIGGGSATYGGIHEGAYVVVAKPSAGKVAAIGDSSPWEDATPKYKREDTGATKTTHAGWTDKSHATLGINIVNWLATPDPATSIDATLQQPATVEPYDVFTLTEPITEPWSTPPAGYLWYDATTFKAGAYNGTNTGGGGTPTWAINPMAPKAYPNNKYAAFLDGQGLTPSGSYSTAAYLYVTSGGTQISTRYNRSTGAYVDGLTAVSLAANSSGKLQRWEFWNLTAATADRALSLRLKVDGSTILTQTVTQVATGSFGYLTVESTLGYSDGLHAASFSKAGVLDTAVQILPTGNTTVTLPAGTYTLEIKNDTTVKRSNVTVTITAGATASLTQILNAGGGGTGKLLINEVYYDTPGDDNIEEWVELYNGTGAAINLSGYKLIDNATTYTFGTVSIAAGGYLTVAKNTTGYFNMHGSNPDVSGLTTAFGNTGDQLTLRNAAGTDLDFVAWENYVTGWSLNAATGQTIYRKDKLVDTNAAADWMVGTPSPKQ